MRWGRAVAYAAYAALAVALASGGLACESAPTSVGPAAPTGPEATPSLSASPLAASVTSVAPHAGAGGSQVTISGTGFTLAEMVCFGSKSSPQYRVSESGTRIIAVVPSGSGTVPVAVITPAGASAVGPDDTFTYRSSIAGSTGTSSAVPVSQCESISAESP